jgi:hypothetical protein
MTEFNALLKRAFAEAPEPVDDGFTLRIGRAVARRESAIGARALIYAIGLGVAGVAVFVGLFPLIWGFGGDLLSSGGLEIARVQGAFNAEAPVLTYAVSEQAQSWLQTLSAGLMSQMLLITVALAGGAVAYRASQD